jgi:hypothetical protein
LLMDEAENLDRSSLRAILNAGFEQAATVPRCVGHGVQDFHVFCPKALACIGHLPSTLADRSIVVRMKRAGLTESLDNLRRRTLGEMAAIAEKSKAWAAANEHAVAEAYTRSSVDFLSGREADIWEALFGIIRVAAPERFEELKATAIRLAAEKAGEDAASEATAIRLLADIKAIFGAEAAEVLPTTRLVSMLRNLPEGPWGRLSSNQLAHQLRPFEIGPKQLWVGGKNQRGYLRRDFVDAFERYTPRANENGAQEFGQAEDKASGLAGLAANAGKGD